MAFIFDEKILDKLKNFELTSKYTAPCPDFHNLAIRPLSIDDYKKGIYDVLTFLTEIGEISEASYIDHFLKMKNASNSYYIVVVEDKSNGQIVACGSLILQYAFTRSCAVRGYIEDISVRKDYQGKQFGKIILNTLVSLAKIIGCYKLNLHCRTEKVEFYQKFGFDIDGENMSLVL